MSHPRMTTEQVAGMDNALVLIENERHRQHAKWGEQNHRDGTGPNVYVLAPTAADLDMRTATQLAQLFTDKTNRHAERGDVTYRDILLEEVFEALAEDDPANLRTELVQTAAVLVAWIEKLDRQAAAS